MTVRCVQVTKTLWRAIIEAHGREVRRTPLYRSQSLAQRHGDRLRELLAR